MDKKLPIYKMTINLEDESGVNYVALVDEPAIQRNWFAFKNQEFKFTADKERRIITGALMIADLPIYRASKERGEYYVVFDKPTIEQIVQKFMKNGFHNNVNMMHDAQSKVSGVNLFEIFIVDSERGIKVPDGFDGITDGSVIASYKIDNEEIWQEFIKTGEFKGFSVEGLFDMEIADNKSEDDIMDLINEIDNFKRAIGF